MKKILSLLVALTMIFACAIPVFAEDGDEETPSVVRIPDGTKVVTSDTLDDGVIERLRVKTIYVPASVTKIEEGALTGYANLTNVYVENSKDNITIESGALPAGTNVVYTEKTTTTTTTSSTTTTTKKAETTTTTTTKKADDSDEKSTTKKTTKKTTTTKRTSSTKATTSDPKDRTTVQHRTLTVPNTKSTTVSTKKPLLPEVQADPDDIEETPDPGSEEEELTTVTFAGEMITDKDGTIIGFEDSETDGASGNSAESRANAIIAVGVGLVGASAVAILFVKFRRRP